MFKDLESAQESFVRFLGQLQQDCKIGFLEWVCKEYSPVPSALESDQYLLEEETEEPGKTFLSLLPEAGGCVLNRLRNHSIYAPVLSCTNLIISVQIFLTR